VNIKNRNPKSEARNNIEFSKFKIPKHMRTAKSYHEAIR